MHEPHAAVTVNLFSLWRGGLLSDITKTCELFFARNFPLLLKKSLFFAISLKFSGKLIFILSSCERKHKFRINDATTMMMGFFWGLIFQPSFAFALFRMVDVNVCNLIKLSYFSQHSQKNPLHFMTFTG
jgi:hypothetical protein